MEKLLFREEQRFTQSWLWAILIVCLWGPLFFPVNSLIEAEKANSVNYNELIFAFFLVLMLAIGFTWLFIKMKLTVEIHTDGVRFKFFPFLNKCKLIKQEEIERFEVRTYRPIAEYGGWGIKGGGKFIGRAYNVKGNIGLQLYLKSGNKILIGTQKQQAIKFAMSKLMDKETKV